MAAFPENDVSLAIVSLRAVRKRPGMYISPVTLDSLRNFLSGYIFRAYEDGRTNFLNVHSPDFSTWLANREGKRISPSFGWAELIDEMVEIGGDAVAMFFSLLEEYAEIVERQIQEADSHLIQ